MALDDGRQPSATILRASSSSPAAAATSALVAAAAGGLLGWNLGRPALWLDEGASVVATQRTWPHLLTLLQGADAPLVPYYALLKLLMPIPAGLIGHAPSLAIAVRWPSALAMVIAALLLTYWLTRRLDPGVALCAAGMLLLSTGFSRYGQEARSYALVLLLATVSTIIWSRLARASSSRWWVVCYAVAIGVQCCFQLLSASLIAAHLVAAVIAVRPERRRPTLWRTACGGVLGLALISPFGWDAVHYGSGADHSPSLSLDHLFAGLTPFGVVGRPSVPMLGVLAPLTLIGVAQVRRSRFRFIGLLALSWAIVPGLVLLPLVLLRPNLLISRYVLFTQPGWSILAGLGLYAVAELIRRAILLRWTTARESPPGSPRRWPGFAALVVAICSALLLVTATAVFQSRPLREIRTAAGHNESILPALASADSGIGARLPIFFANHTFAVELQAYAPQDSARLIGASMQTDQTSIWPAAMSVPVEWRELARHSQVDLMLRSAAARRGCDFVHRAATTKQIQHCLPPILQQLRFTVVGSENSGRDWAFAILRRMPAVRSGTPRS